MLYAFIYNRRPVSFHYRNLKLESSACGVTLFLLMNKLYDHMIRGKKKLRLSSSNVSNHPIFFHCLLMGGLAV